MIAYKSLPQILCVLGALLLTCVSSTLHLDSDEKLDLKIDIDDENYEVDSPGMAQVEVNYKQDPFSASAVHKEIFLGKQENIKSTEVDHNHLGEKDIILKNISIISHISLEEDGNRLKPETLDDKTEQEELNIFYQSLPSFIPDYTIVKNVECRREGQIFLSQLRKHELWTLQMLDANAKIPSGILRGNLNQLGDFDACMESSAQVEVYQDKPIVSIQGKYCLAEIDFEAVTETARIPVYLMQSRHLMKSSKNEPGHFVPKFTSINWALCLPSACTHEDAEEMLLHAIAPYNISTGVKITLHVKEDMCYTKKHIEWWNYSFETLATLGFFCFIILMVCVATIKDCQHSSTVVKPRTENDGTFCQIMMAFSMKRSGRDLLKNDTNDDDIQCIHGIRAITTLFLYYAHKIVPLSGIPFANKLSLTEVTNRPISMIFRVSVVHTDAFLLISGVLAAYQMSKDIRKKGKISWFTKLISRYIRLTPILLAVLLFYAYVWDHIGTGPKWSSVVTANAKLCQTNMWQNLLYIQNFYPFQNMCATHTHQLALDMQLTLIAPIFVWILYRRPISGLVLFGGLHTLSIGLRYFSTLNNQLSMIFYHGVTYDQLMHTADLSYKNPLHRITPYLAGVGLGFLLRNTGKNIKLSKQMVDLGWMVTLYLVGWTLIAPVHLAGEDYQYDVKEAAKFSALATVTWSLALCWLIFACHTNNAGWINSLLSSRPFVLFSRISYAVYLIQFVIFFYNVGTYRSSAFFDTLEFFNILELATVIIASVVVTLLFDIPMQTIRSIVMKLLTGQKYGNGTEILEKKDKRETTG